MLKNAAPLLVLTLLGCVVSPQPEPPGLESMTYRLDSIEGARGAVPTAEGNLHVYALFGELPAAVAPVNDDGSFGPVPFMFPGDDSWARAEVRVGDVRSETVDFMREGDTAVPIVFPIPCVSVDPVTDYDEVVVGVRARQLIVVTNNCLEQTSIGTDFNALRFGDRGFDADFAPPIEIPAGESISLPMDLTAMAPGLVEDVFSLDIRRGMDRDRRFVTLVAIAR